MESRSFDRLARNAANGVSRRTTLMTLGAAGLAALIGPFAAEAKKGGKKNKKKNNVPPALPAPLECPPPTVDLCPAQVNSCKAILGAQCGGSPNCTDEIPCCDLLATCDASGFWACLLTASRS
jgi:hypothetical protein